MTHRTRAVPGVVTAAASAALAHAHTLAYNTPVESLIVKQHTHSGDEKVGCALRAPSMHGLGFEASERPSGGRGTTARAVGGTGEKRQKQALIRARGLSLGGFVSPRRI